MYTFYLSLASVETSAYPPATPILADFLKNPSNVPKFFASVVNNLANYLQTAKDPSPSGWTKHYKQQIKDKKFVGMYSKVKLNALALLF